MTVELYRLPEARTALEALATILHDCVHGGASLGFILPFERPDARRYWQTQVFPALEQGDVVLLVAHIEGAIAGTVQLQPASKPNQSHRAEICKLMVAPEHRRRGLGRILMLAAEDQARQLDRSLLTLDTACEDMAAPLYRELGFVEAGRIPGYARNPVAARLDATILMYKAL